MTNYTKYTKTKLQWKKLHVMNLSSNFLRGSFSNRNNVISPIQFQRKRQSHHLYKMIFYEGPDPSIFTPIARVKAISYYSSWCLQDQIQVQKQTWAVAIGKIICIYQEGGPTDHQHWQGILVKPSHQKPPKTVFDKKIWQKPQLELPEDTSLWRRLHTIHQVPLFERHYTY